MLRLPRTYREDWPIHIIERARVVVGRTNIPECEACEHRPRPHDRYCRNCGRTLDWRG